MVWEENSRICLHMQLIAILSRIGVAFALTGRQVCVRNNPGRCPGLGASALSGRVGLTCESSVNYIKVSAHQTIGNNHQNGYLMILCKVLRDTLQSITYYLPKYHVILFSLSFLYLCSLTLNKEKLHPGIKKKTSYFFCYSTHLHYL